MLLFFKKQKLISSTMISYEHVMPRIKPVNALKFFSIVTKRRAASFLQKRTISRIKQLHLGHFSKFCLSPQLFKTKQFCRKPILCNSFITTNANALTKTILENPYKVLKRTRRTITLKRRIHFSQAVIFLITLNI